MTKKEALFLCPAFYYCLAAGCRFASLGRMAVSITALTVPAIAAFVFGLFLFSLLRIGLRGSSFWLYNT